MRVLTHREHELLKDRDPLPAARKRKKKEEEERHEEVKGGEEVKVQGARQEGEVVLQAHRLFHPENPADCYISREEHATVNGKTIRFSIENGTVVTTSEELKRHLISRGYELIGSTPIDKNKE